MSGKLRSQAEALAISRELKRRRLAKGDLLDLAFDKQLAVINDDCRKIAIDCMRRAGKSYGIALLILWTAMQNPGCNVLYLARSRAKAKEIMEKDIFGVLAKKLGLQSELKLHGQDLTIHLSNGSRIKLSGADVSRAQIANLVGQKNKLVVIDEAQYFSANLITTIREGIEPTLTDEEGTLVMIGVPSQAHGFFWSVVRGETDTKTGQLVNPGWSIHRWSAEDNPHQRDAYRRDLAKLRLEDPLFCETATFKNQWLGEWVDDPLARCYPFNREINWIKDLPKPVSSYTWLCGIDVGFHPDPMAFVVMGYQPQKGNQPNIVDDRTLYIVHSHKQTRMSLDEVEAYRRTLEKTWPIEGYVIDGSNTNVFNELRSRFDMPLVAATKVQKAKFIGIMADDMQAARVRICGHGADSLMKEWQDLTWEDPSAEKLKEDPGCQNHLTDAALYGWRQCYHWLKKPEAPPVQIITGQMRVDHYRERMEQRLRNEQMEANLEFMYDADQTFAVDRGIEAGDDSY